MFKSFILLVMSFIGLDSGTFAQNNITKTIQSFGAKGDGKTNDTEAFTKAAAFFNDRGGNGTLLISKGIYIVGKQIPGNGDVNKNAYTGVDILAFKNIQNLLIQGEKQTILKYTDKLKFGSFDPVTGKIFNDNSRVIPDPKYAASIGTCIGLNNCRNITIKSLILDGNNKSIIKGGTYGDVGIQLAHIGIYINNCHAISIDKINASYFGLDGIEVTNIASGEPDNINISNTVLEYNCRQGLSWVGGNFLNVKNCSFNHTGRSAYNSAPSAGLDIEPEVNTISNGNFENCQFINNTGCGVVTSGNKASNCQFKNCTFWGTTNWSFWISAPSFTFTGCNFYGSIVHGYNANNEIEATRFIRCNFEDKVYNGITPYGQFLLECDGPRRILFDSCNFITHTKAVLWLNTGNAKSTEEKATIRNSHFFMPKKKGLNSPVSIPSINFFNNTTEFKN